MENILSGNPLLNYAATGQKNDMKVNLLYYIEIMCLEFQIFFSRILLYTKIKEIMLFIIFLLNSK